MTEHIDSQNIPIFVCSTYEDLKEYRGLVRDVLIGLKIIVIGMENFGSRPGTPKNECIKAVQECKAFIGIFGTRYGTIDEETGKSYSHLEYEEASRLKLPSLIYLIDEEKQPVLPKYVDKGDRAEKLRMLKEQLKKDHTVTKFTNPDDLAKHIAQDVPTIISDIKKQSEMGIDVFKRAYEDWKNYDILTNENRTRFLLDSLEHINLNGDELEFVIRLINSDYYVDIDKQITKFDKESVLPICEKILKNSGERYYLRWRILNFLFKINPIGAKSILWDVYHDPKNWDIKDDVLFLLGKCDPRTAIIEARTVLLFHQDYKMREKAAHVLGFTRKSKDSIEALRKGLLDKKQEVRTMSAVGLTKIKNPNNGCLLLNAFKREKSAKAGRKLFKLLMTYREDPKIATYAKKKKFPKWWWESNPRDAWMWEKYFWTRPD